MKALSDYYPLGVNELPGDNLEENDYIFEVTGELTVKGYSEEDAEYWLEQDIESHLYDAYKRGDIEIR